MANENKVYRALPTGIEVYYLDTQVSERYRYPQSSDPVSPFLNIVPKVRVEESQYQKHDDFRLNKYQRRFLNDALLGLQSYSLQQLSSMSLQEKITIIDLHRRSSEALREWKQKLFYGIVDDFLLHGIPGFDKLKDKLNEALKVGKQFVSYDRDEDVPISFRELNVSKKDIAQYLHSKGLLPKDFFQAAA